MFRFALAACFAVSVLCIAFVAPEWASAQNDAPRLFSIVEAAKPASESDRSSVASVREADIAFGSDPVSVLSAGKIQIPLFDNKDHEATRVDLERRGERFLFGEELAHRSEPGAVATGAPDFRLRNEDFGFETAERPIRNPKSPTHNRVTRAA